MPNRPHRLVRILQVLDVVHLQLEEWICRLEPNVPVAYSERHHLLPRRVLLTTLREIRRELLFDHQDVVSFDLILHSLLSLLAHLNEIRLSNHLADIRGLVELPPNLLGGVGVFFILEILEVFLDEVCDVGHPELDVGAVDFFGGGEEDLGDVVGEAEYLAFEVEEDDFEELVLLEDGAGHEEVIDGVEDVGDLEVGGLDVA